MTRTIKEITEELYPLACGNGYVPDDAAHEDMHMSISWRMAGALHFLLHRALTGLEIYSQEHPSMEELSLRRLRLWHELGYGLICRICKAKHPSGFETTPMDEFTEFRHKGSGAAQ